MTAPGTAEALTLHASCVVLDGKGLLILGPSGAGKSSLAIACIARGALLVSDDQTRVTATSDGMRARCPRPELAGLIEARGLGLLRAASAAEARLALAIDLGQVETERLPPRRSLRLLGHELPLVLRPQNAHLADALVLWLRGGRQE